LLTGSRTDTPLLTSVTAAYLPRNIRPEVTSITINQPGTVYQRPFPTGDPEIAGFDGEVPDRRNPQSNPSGPNLGRRTYQRVLLDLCLAGAGRQIATIWCTTCLIGAKVSRPF